MYFFYLVDPKCEILHNKLYFAYTVFSFLDIAHLKAMCYIENYYKKPMIVGYVLYLFVYNLYVVMPDNETMQYSTSVQVLAKYLYENSTVVRCSQFPKGAAKTYVTEMYYLCCSCFV